MSGPTKKGTSINVELWEKFLGMIDDINTAIANMQANVQKREGKLGNPGTAHGSSPNQGVPYSSPNQGIP